MSRDVHTKRPRDEAEEERKAPGTAAEKPSHHLPNGRFDNIWGDEDPGAYAKLKFLCGSWTKRPKLPSQKELDEQLPVVEPDWTAINSPDPNKLNVTWIGHASFLVQLGGFNVLTDPVFSDRASPVSFGGPFRYRPLPFKLEQLPKIDLVVISHSHYDHLDRYTVGELNRRKGGTHFLVGLGTSEWFRDEGITAVTELDWWQQAPASLFPGLQITCLPVQHWSMRKIGDRNKALWCSWALKATCGRSVYFTGDSAYCPVFSDIGAQLGPFDCALIPIGAFKPQQVLRHHHMSPNDAVQVHVDLRAERSVACHWGTLRQMAHEHVLEPKWTLEAELDKRGLPRDLFRTSKHGQTLFFPPAPP